MKWPARTRVTIKLVVGGLWLLALAGCGNGLDGTYRGEGEDKIEFKDGGKVYVTMWPAPTLAGTYDVDGDKVIVTVNDQSIVFTLSGQTLEGGPFGQKFTRFDGESSSVAAAATP